MRRCDDPTRRYVLKTGAALAAAAMAPSMPACGPPPPPPSVRVPIASLDAGARVVVDLAGIAVEVHRAADGRVISRYLMCTHMACKVTWKPAKNQYDCACHEASFDADGKPRSGPVNQPLMDLPYVIDGTDVVLTKA